MHAVALSAQPGPWSPLRNRLFRAVWLATLVSNIGTWMNDVGAGWLMTSLASSPAIVSLVAAAGTLPVMLLALPAGAIADIVDRRRLLMAVQVYFSVVIGALAVLTLLGLMTPWLLLAFSFAVGIGTALALPTFAAIVPQLVPAAELSSAVALNSIGINISRAIGPAIGGLIVSAVGPWLVFALDAISSIGVLIVLARWRSAPRRSTLPTERLFTAIRIGLRFIAHTHALQAVLIRGAAFFIFASATWALFPLVVRQELQRGPEVYGVLLTCIGVGAVAGAILLPRVREKMSRSALVAAASALYAAAALMLAQVHNVPLLMVAMLATGVAWIAILASLQVSAQLTLPDWVRARGLAAFVMIFMGGMALGAIGWGQVAARIGIPAALTAAALGILAAIALTWRFRLREGNPPDFTPSMDWAAPVLAEGLEPDAGPVLVTIEYQVQPEKRAEFVAAMRDVREMRRRNGAFFWELFHEAAEPTRYVETFMDESWVEHLRQHERVSVADREIQHRANRFLVKGASTKSTHWLADR
ncbi:MAG TPA: MFS transporter [Burkholderiales bacterium]|nr:MFS transporter [Burkholderiales bacterium]